MYRRSKLIFASLWTKILALSLIVVVSAVTASILPTNPVSASTPAIQTVPGNLSIAPVIGYFAADNINTNADGEEIVCVAGALGYITCPLLDISAKMIRFIAVLLDVVFNFQALNNDAIRGVWGLFTNLANVSLAIVFLIIIVSQASSIGISSYGIKRMLPRLIAAAILINMSFYFCAIAIDLSNVLGKNMMDFIGTLTTDELNITNEAAKKNPDCQTLGNRLGRFGGNLASWFSGPGLAARVIGQEEAVRDIGGAVGTGIGTVADKVGGIFGATTGCKMAIIAAGLVGGINIVTLIIAIILIAVFIAFIVTMALAFMRYVILVFLVILAPLAFAAWVLPGTEGLFKKWWNLFLKLLMIYPAAMFMFGASIFVASLIGAIVNNGGFIADLFPDAGITQDAIDAVWAAFQLFVIAMPLFFIPKLFKSMDSITGGIAGKLAAAGTVGGMMRGAKKIGKTAKKGREMYNRTPYGQFKQQQYAEDLAHARAGHKTRSRRANLRGSLERSMGGKNAEYIRSLSAQSEGITEKRLTEEQLGLERRYAAGQSTAGFGDSDSMFKIATNSDGNRSESEIRAATAQLFKRRDTERLSALKDHVVKSGDQRAIERYNKAFAENGNLVMAQAPDLNLGAMADGFKPFAKPTKESAATWSVDTLKRATKQAIESNDPVYQQRLAQAFQDTLDDDRLVINHEQRRVIQEYHQDKAINFKPTPKSPSQPTQPSGPPSQPTTPTPRQKPIQTQGRTFDPPKEEGGLWIPRSRD